MRRPSLPAQTLLASRPPPLLPRAVRFNALAPAEALGPRPGSYAVAQVLAGAGRGSESWSAYDYHLHNSTSAILATNLVYPSNDVTRYSLASHCASGCPLGAGQALLTDTTFPHPPGPTRLLS